MTDGGAAPQTAAQRPCLNCGDATGGNYCRMCGQRKAEHRASVGRLLADALQDQLSLTSELPRTLRALFTRPGFLTAEYSAGRIARYIPPFRLYLVASLLFFLTLSIRSDRVVRVTSTDGANATADSLAATTAGQDSIGTERGDTTRNRGPSVRTPFEGLNKRLAARSEELDKLPPGEAQRRLSEFLVQRGPTVIFLLLPLFALLLKIFYWRSGRFYAEHFVFALHTHAFSFVVFTAIIMLKGDGWQDYVQLGLLLWTAGYLLFALKRFYGQGWILTPIKYFLICVLYFTLLMVGLIIEVIAAMLLI